MTVIFFPKGVLRASAAALALLSLSACGGPEGAGPSLGWGDTTALRYDVEHPISVENRPEMLQLPVGGGLSPRDERHIEAFAREYMATGQSKLTIAYPQGANAGRKVNAISAKLTGAGVPASHVVRGPYSTARDGQRGLVVSYYAAQAVASECPEHPGDTLIAWRNETPSRFGCAYQKNLAAMMADPRDLAEPRPMSPISSERRQKVLRDYQDGESTASEQNGEKTDTRDQ